jgi:hypothetical protein
VRNEENYTEFRKRHPEIPAEDVYKTLMGNRLRHTLQTGKKFEKGGVMGSNPNRRELLKRGIPASHVTVTADKLAPTGDPNVTAYALPFRQGGVISAPPNINIPMNPYQEAIARASRKIK